MAVGKTNKTPTSKSKGAKAALEAAKEKKAKELIPEVSFGENYRTAQIYSRGFEFAFMSLQDGVWKQACTFVYCKDFLHDAVWAAVNKTKWEVYGFKYDSSKDVPLDRAHCAMAFRNTLYKDKSEDFHGKREACQAFLNGIEDKLGFEPSRIYQVPHADAPCWLIVGDSRWQHAPPLVGFYTLFIRLGFMHEVANDTDKTLQLARDGKIKIGDGSSYAGNKDCSYIAQAWDGIQVLFKHGIQVFHEKMEENYPLDLPKRGISLHDHLGPVNFTKRYAEKAMPHWYRDEIWK